MTLIKNVRSIMKAVLFAFGIYQLLITVTHCSSPVVVVISNSMTPSYNKGDLVFLHNDGVFNVGDVVTYKLSHKEIPIMHRITRLEKDDDNNYKILTKGDANNVNDISLYGNDRYYLQNNDIIGKVLFSIPYVGNVRLWMNEYIMAFGIIVSTFFIIFPKN